MARDIMIFTRIARLQRENGYNAIEEVWVTYNWSTGRFKVILPETVSPYLR